MRATAGAARFTVGRGNEDLSPVPRPSTLYGAEGEAFDETVEEEVVEDSDGDGDDHGGGHQGLPEVDVAADQLGGDACGDGLAGGGGDEGEGVDELVEREGEGEDDDGQEA